MGAAQADRILSVQGAGSMHYMSRRFWQACQHVFWKYVLSPAEHPEHCRPMPDAPLAFVIRQLPRPDSGSNSFGKQPLRLPSWHTVVPAALLTCRNSSTPRPATPPRCRRPGRIPAGAQDDKGRGRCWSWCKAPCSLPNCCYPGYGSATCRPLPWLSRRSEDMNRHVHCWPLPHAARYRAWRESCLAPPRPVRECASSAAIKARRVRGKDTALGGGAAAGHGGA